MKFLINVIKNIYYIFVSNPVTCAEYKDGIMTVNYKRGQVEQYKGSCTVWRKLPSMKRCGTLTESWLLDLWKYNKNHGIYIND
jgi:hypothetical protein